ncbi:MAG: twin-arginine translocation signal domain-containing protein [Chloroflexia bacterium]
MDTYNTLAGSQVSRRNFLKGAGAGAAGFTLAQIGFLRHAAAESESLQDILNITATTERFGITFLGEGLQSAKAGNYNKPIPDSVIAIVTAARAQEQFHLDAFERAGGVPLVDKFYIPPAALTDYDTFFSAIVLQETVETAAQIAAMTTFTKMKRPDLAKVSFQYAAEESEHRLVANYALGTRPANDVAFAPAIFDTVAGFYQSLKDRGIIGGPGTEINFQARAR